MIKVIGHNSNAMEDFLIDLTVMFENFFGIGSMTINAFAYAFK
ncbi:hypothetical protein MNB_SV-4-54 [hydrothermal vent metagenome]|uniref:Uncharacterized protein n=1 Tax=hydrothermal vent metagenome TaxID=652676 RepID=A0A1W1E825_9ZZZZ